MSLFPSFGGGVRSLETPAAGAKPRRGNSAKRGISSRLYRKSSRSRNGRISSNEGNRRDAVVARRALEIFGPFGGADAAWRRARTRRLVDVTRRNHARFVRRHFALSRRRTKMAMARPHDPQQGSRLYRAIRDAGRKGLHSIRRVGYLFPPGFHSWRATRGLEDSGRRSFNRFAGARIVLRGGHGARGAH